ncbi:NAD-dependent epimerase/dehydratase family protein [Croceicoccus sediminis]|uniref:NAD-dependent epimerase/dehydratase family protein n=1 Tax=Croceicoccus sediminis TaxID=2571150 RepID=UPI0011836ADE|nr:sugar nucleotide-binding protein [Croceicoccus sediminis]
MRVGLTGATGTLGRHVLAALRGRGIEPDVFTGDVTDAPVTASWAQACGLVIHCAAMVPVREVEADPARALAVNAGGTINIATGLARTGGRLALVSTSHVYEPSDDPIAEDGALGPATAYGMTKLDAENWARRMLPDALVLRLFSYFDARQDPLFVVPALAFRIERAAQGESLDLFGADSTRDMADAAWLAGRLVDLALGSATGAVNVCTGRGFAIRDLAARLAAAMGRSDVSFVPAGTGRNALVGANGKMCSLLPELPPFDLDEALAAFVEAREKAGA